MSKIQKKPYGPYSSTREGCFNAFLNGVRPVALKEQEPHLNLSTIYSYWHQWKQFSAMSKDPFLKEWDASLLRKILKDPESKKAAYAWIARAYGLKVEDIEKILIKPWGYYGMTTGKSQKMMKLRKAMKELELALSLVEGCQAKGIEPEGVMSEAFKFVEECRSKGFNSADVFNLGIDLYPDFRKRVGPNVHLRRTPLPAPDKAAAPDSKEQRDAKVRTVVNDLINFVARKRGGLILSGDGSSVTPAQAMASIEEMQRRGVVSPGGESKQTSSNEDEIKADGNPA